MASLVQGGTSNGLLVYTPNEGDVEKIVIGQIIGYTRQNRKILIFTPSMVTTTRFAQASQANAAENLLDSLF